MFLASPGNRPGEANESAPATLATIFLERLPLGALVVRLITRDPIGISGDEYLCVASSYTIVEHISVADSGGAQGARPPLWERLNM